MKNWVQVHSQVDCKHDDSARCLEKQTKFVVQEGSMVLFVRCAAKKHYCHRKKYYVYRTPGQINDQSRKVEIVPEIICDIFISCYIVQIVSYPRRACEQVKP